MTVETRDALSARRGSDSPGRALLSWLGMVAVFSLFVAAVVAASG